MRYVQTRNDRSPFFFDSFFEDFDRLFQDARVTSLEDKSQGAAQPIFKPTYELVENEKGYLLSFDLPGIPKDAIQIEVKNKQLRVSGERKFENSRAEGARSYSERRYGRFERVFELPSDIDTEKIEAHHADGVLNLLVPKAERAQAREIKIQTGQNGSAGFFSRLIGKDQTKENETEKTVKVQ